MNQHQETVTICTECSMLNSIDQINKSELNRSSWWSINLFFNTNKKSYMTIIVHPNFDQTDNNQACKLKCINGPVLINCGLLNRIELIGTFPTHKEIWNFFLRPQFFLRKSEEAGQVSLCRASDDGVTALSVCPNPSAPSPTLIICIWFPTFSFSLGIDFFPLISISFSILLSQSIALCLILNPFLLQIWDSGWSSNFSLPDSFTTNGQVVLFLHSHPFFHSLLLLRIPLCSLASLLSFIIPLNLNGQFNWIVSQYKDGLVGSPTDSNQVASWLQQKVQLICNM